MAILYLLVNLSLSTHEYYVTNSSNITQDNSCIVDDKGLHPCFSLDGMADYLHFISRNISNISIYFLSEYYPVYGNMTFLFESFTEVHLRPWENGSQVVIYCIDELSLTFIDISIIDIKSFTFLYCGKYKHIISGNNGTVVQISDAEFLRSRYGFVSLNKVQKLVLINNCIFDGNMKDFAVAINLSTSAVHIVNTSFIHNAGGFIVSHSSANISMTNCQFINNSMGGAVILKSIIRRESTFLTITGSNFMNNSGINGGALKITNLEKISVSHSKFGGNQAHNEGGAVAIEFNLNGALCFAKISFKNCSFWDNMARGGGGGIFSETFKYCQDRIYLFNSTFVNNSAKEGGALSIINQKNVFISYSNFIKNSGTAGGALDLYGVDKLRVSDSNFAHNKVRNIKKITANYECSQQYSGAGGAITIRPVYRFVFFITDCVFHRNSASLGGAIFGGPLFAHLVSKSTAAINKSNFTYNKALNCGGALSLHIFKNITIYKSNFYANTAAVGGALNLNKATSSVIHCIFQENEANMGGAIHCGTYTILNVTNIFLQGNKAAHDGGGISMVLSFLNVRGGLNYFLNNTAMSGKGGAVYVEDRLEDCHVNVCPVVWKHDTIINCSNNSANTGSVLYGGMIDRCYIGNSSVLSIRSAVISIETDLDSPAITSDVIKFCYYHNNCVPYCDIRTINESLFPGQSLTLLIVCLDQMEQARSCDIKSEYYATTKIKLGEGESSITIDGFENVTFHAFSKEKEFGILLMNADTICEQPEWNNLQVNITIKDSCPLGFEKETDRCQCDHRLKEMLSTIECDINSNMMTLSEEGWFGYDEKYLRIYKDCLINYNCSVNEKTLCPTCSNSWCDFHHGGILCGGCVANYSVVLGSWKCMNCSNLSRYNFIWLTVVIALAGVVLVLFLLLVKMTVSSGTINGLIFYANIISFSGLLDYNTHSIHPILRVFLSWINLDFGIEVCFYSGMDVYQKTWLQFIFPFYIWFLVGVIILFCHYSSTVMKLMGMRNIEVLATLFLLSYAKLLKTIVTALSFTDIMVASADNVSDNLISQKVWVYDGNINYFSKKHLPMFIVALVFLLILFLPYTLLLLFGQSLRSLPSIKGRQWIQGTAITSIMDAYHAPYTRHHRYWTGLGLLVRCCLFTIFSSSYNIQKNLFWINFSIIFMIAIRQLFKVYQKKTTNYLELFYFTNLGVLCAALQYKYDSCYLLNISAALSFIVFLCTLVYHVTLQMRAYFPSYNQIKNKLLHSMFKIKATSNTDTDQEILEADICKGHSTTYVELRETLIDS